MRAGDDFVGWEDKVHGGMLATLLDEVMAWAPSSYDSWAVTAEMNLRYRTLANGRRAQRARLGHPATAPHLPRPWEVHGEGWPADRRGRRALPGSITDPEGRAQAAIYAPAKTTDATVATRG